MGKTVDPILPAKVSTTSTDDEQMPTLISMIIEGLPPLDQSEHVHEAEKRLIQYLDRWQISMYRAYILPGLSSASYMHPRVVSIDHLVAIATLYALMFLLDDIFIDTREPFLFDQYVIDHSAGESPQTAREYLDYLNAVFGQRKPPSNPKSKMEMIMFELGRDILRLSGNNLEWFDLFIDTVIAHHRASVDSLAELGAGDNSCVLDLKAYSLMRGKNVGGYFAVRMVEFSSMVFIPTDVRSDPFLQKIPFPTAVHLGFANDMYSFHRESSLEGNSNPRNLIKLLMATEGKSFVPALKAAIEITNGYAGVLVGLAAEAGKTPLFKQYLKDILTLVAGNVYFGCYDKRYRQADSVFPEQRDVHSSWKFLLHDSGGPGL